MRKGGEEEGEGVREKMRELVTTQDGRWRTERGRKVC